jgi:hypothetical protein
MRTVTDRGRTHPIHPFPHSLVPPRVVLSTTETTDERRARLRQVAVVADGCASSTEHG